MNIELESFFDDALKQEPSTPVDVGMDDFIGQQIDNKQRLAQQQIKSQLEFASRADPDQEAEVSALSKELKLPPITVRNKLHEARRIRTMIGVDIKELMAKSPILARQLKDPEFARLSYDDINEMGTLEGIVNDAKIGWKAGQLQDELGQLHYQQKWGSEEHQARIKQIDDELQSLYGSGGVIENASKITGQMSQSFPKAIETGLKYSATAITATAVAGQLGPQVALPEELITIPLAGSAAFAAGFGGTMADHVYKVESGFSYNDMIEAGVSPEMSHNASTAVGMINASLELGGASAIVAPFRPLLRKIIQEKTLKELTRSGAALGFVKNYSLALGVETGTEILQDAVGWLGEDAARLMTDDLEARLATSQGREEFVNQLWETFEAVGKGMSLLALPGASVSFIGDSKRAGNARKNSEFMQSLGDAALATKTRERAPDAFERYVKAITEDGPVEEVYIDAGKLVHYFQSQNIDAIEIPGLTEQLNEALERGGDVRIPLDQYTSKIASTEHHEELKNHIKFDPDDMTLIEAEQWQSNQAEQFKVDAEKIMAEKEGDVAFLDSAEQVHDDIKAQILKTGRFDDSVADKYAALHQAFAVSMSEKMGLQPHEVYEQYGLKVRALGLDGKPYPDTLMQKAGNFVKNALGQKGDSVELKNAAFDPDQSESADLLYQQERGGIYFPDNISQSPSIMSLFEEADLSTFLHESGHFFFEVMNHIASQPDAPTQVNEDMNALLDFVGVDSLETWNTMTFEQRREGHEKVAEAFEKYLFDGESPSIELQSLFQRLREFMLGVYKNLRNMPIELTDEVRSVFDRMIATDEQIKIAEQAGHYKALFESAEQGGMTADEWRNYQALDPQADAREQLNARGLRNLKWLDNARSKIMKATQREGREKRREVRMDVRAKVLQMPIYQAWDFLKGAIQKPLSTPKANPQLLDPTRDSLLVAIAKMGGMNKQTLVDSWGLDPADKPESGVFGKPVLRKEGGMTPDGMAEALSQDGYLTLDINGKWDLHEFEEHLFDELGGTPHFSIFNDPANRDDYILGSGRDPDLLPVDINQTPNGKLSIEALKEMYGEDGIWQQFPRGRYSFIAKDGLHPDQVAVLFDFSSGDELVQKLLSAEKPKDLIERMTDQRMMELHGELVDPKQMKEAANEALHNKARTKMVNAELKYLNRRTGKPQVLAAAAKAFAEQAISRLQVSQIKASQYLASEVRAGRLATKAQKDGNLDEAAEHKRAQVLNHYFYKAALQSQKEVDRARRYVKKFNSKNVRKAIDSNFTDRIDAILEQYDFKTGTGKADKRESFKEWYDAQVEQGLVPDVDDKLVANANLKHYKNLTMEELRSLIESIKSIEHVGRLKNRLLTNQNRRVFTQAVNDAVESIAINANRTHKDKIEHNTGADRLNIFASGYFAEHRKMSSIAREMDGSKDNGVMWDLFIRSKNERENFHSTERQRATKTLMPLFKPLKDLDKPVYIKEIDYSLTWEGILSIALNSGNEANRLRVMDGDNWSAPQVQAILDHLSKEQWDFVQGVWDFIETYWPMIEAKEKRVFGVAPQKVEALPVQTKFGEYRGGYYPIDYDRERSAQAASHDLAANTQQLLSGFNRRATTRRDFTKARANRVKNRPVEKQLSVVFNHIEEVLHDLAWHEWLIDVNRLLSDPKIESIMRKHYGNQIPKQLRNAVNAIALGDPVSGTWGKVIDHVRQGSTVAALGFNLMTGVLQPFGLSQSIVRIGPKWVGRGLAKWIADPESSVANVHSMSEFMKARHLNINREISEIRNKVRGSGKLTNLQESYFYFITKAQMIADMPTWIGAYEKAMDSEVGHQRSMDLADQAVRDSQGTGNIGDLAEVQRGSPFQKLWTNFYSYFNVTWNMTTESYRRTHFKSPLEVGRFMVDMLMLYTVPAVMAEYMRSAIRGDEIEDDEWAETIVRWQLSYMLGTLIGVRELSGAAAGFANYSGPPGTRFFSESAKFVKQMVQGEVDIGLLKALNNTSGIVLKYPAGAVNRLADGIIALEDGETKNPLAPLIGVPR